MSPPLVRFSSVITVLCSTNFSIFFPEFMLIICLITNTVCAFSVFHGGQCEQRWVLVLLNLQRIISLFNAVIWWVFQNYLCLAEVQLESMSPEPHRPGSIQSLPVYQSDPGQVTPTPQCALYSADGDSTCLRARMRTRWTSWRKNFASSLTHL